MRPSQLRMRPTVFFGVSIAVLLGLIALAIVKLVVAQRDQDDAAINVWLNNLVSYALLTAVLLVAFFSRQLWALIASFAISHGRGNRKSIAVTHWGPRTLTGDSGVKQGWSYFSRCLVADAGGLTLLSPFGQSSTLPWTKVGDINAQLSVELGTNRYLVHIRRTEPVGDLFFLPHSHGFGGWGPDDKSRLSSDLRQLAQLRPDTPSSAL